MGRQVSCAPSRRDQAGEALVGRDSAVLRVALWMLGSVVVGILLVGAPALSDWTGGKGVDWQKLVGQGQLLPGVIAALIAAEANMLRSHQGAPAARAVLGAVGMIVLALTAYWWGDISAGGFVNHAFVTTWSPLLYGGSLLIIGSCVVLST